MIWLLIVLGLAVVMTAAVILLGRRLRSFAAAFLTGLGILTAIWVLGEVLRDAHWHNVDGFVDCYPSCGFWDHVGAVFFWVPPLIALVLVVVVPIAAARHRRKA